MTKPIKEKHAKTKCEFYKCLSRDHGDQICEAIRLYGSTEHQSISYLMVRIVALCNFTIY